MILHAHHYAPENVLKPEGVKDLPPEVIDACPQHLLPSSLSTIAFILSFRETESSWKRNFLGASPENAYASSAAQDGARAKQKTFSGRDSDSICIATKWILQTQLTRKLKNKKKIGSVSPVYVPRVEWRCSYCIFNDFLPRSRLQRRNTSLAAFFRVCVSSEHTKIISVDLFFMHQHFSSVKMCFIAMLLSSAGAGEETN